MNPDNYTLLSAIWDILRQDYPHAVMGSYGTYNPTAKQTQLDTEIRIHTRTREYQTYLQIQLENTTLYLNHHRPAPADGYDTITLQTWDIAKPTFKLTHLLQAINNFHKAQD